MRSTASEHRGPKTPGWRPRRALVFLLLLTPLALPADDHAEFTATYTVDLLRNQSGGLATGSRYLDDLSLTLRLEFDSGPGTSTLFINGLYNNGTHFSRDLVGDLQVVSNIEADEALRLYEAWYEYGDERWSVRGGLYDLNSEFDVSEIGALFLNGSHGIGADIGQTGRNGPGIFPVSALALRGSVALGSGQLMVAALDAVPGDEKDAGSNRIKLDNEEGALLIAEFSHPFRGLIRARGAFWAYTEDFERPFETGPLAVSNGWYLGVEGGRETASGPLGWFLRYGRADPDVNVFEDYVGAGVVLPSPIGSRADDRVGVAVASAGAGAPYRRWQEQAGQVTRSRETAWELTYRMPVSQHLALQPDIQYVQNPAALAGIGNALVLGLRVELSY